MTSVIYIISSTTPEEKCFKIGLTDELANRFRNIKTGNQYPVKIEYYEEVEKNIDIHQFEIFLHNTFSKERMEGEWFHNISVKEIRKKIYFYLLK